MTEPAYPDTGPLAVLARLGFFLALVAIAVAVIAPGWLTPKILHSHYLQHFAAFYVAALAGAAAMPRARMRHLAAGYMIFAALLQGVQGLKGGDLEFLLDNWVADTGGTAAALVPIVVERYRRRFPAKA